MMTEIRRRERELKQSRAKTLHPGEFDPYQWYGGGFLDYRFGNAKVIIGDIFESEGIYAKSKSKRRYKSYCGCCVIYFIKYKNI